MRGMLNQFQLDSGILAKKFQCNVAQPGWRRYSLL